MTIPEIIKYISYYRSCRSRYEIHSPFVYKLYSQLLNDRKEYPEYLEIEKQYPDIDHWKYYRLLFRLSAFFKPGIIFFDGMEKSPEQVCLQSGFPPGKLILNNYQVSGTIDLAFLDLGISTGSITGRFSSLLQHTTKETVFTIWNLMDSGTSLEDWKSLKGFPEVTATIDLFRVGLVFINKDLSREDFVIRF